jgi:prepilin-type N-terminal cleavage/methylation domain-containing protein
MTTARGLSLIEVVIAIVILGLAVPPLMLQMVAGVQQQEAMLIQQDLTQLASERMWEIYADHTNPTRGYSYVVDASYPTETAPRGLTGYTRETTIHEVSEADYLTLEPGSGVKRFQVVVTGPGGQTLAIEAFVTEIGGAATS